jgi:dCMP deaminase
MKIGKREDYIGWDGYFVMVAFISSLRSKDPSTRNGACIVDEDNHIIATGYNGFPKGCGDDDFPWGREKEGENSKYPFVVHAESNAILNANSSLKGTRLFLYSEKGYYPCCECAKSIIQSGIAEVVMATAIKENTDVYDWSLTKRMFEAANVKIRVIQDVDLATNVLKTKFALDKFVDEVITRKKL